MFERGRTKRNGGLPVSSFSSSSSSDSSSISSSSQQYPYTSRMQQDRITFRGIVSSGCEKHVRSSLVLMSRNILDQLFLQFIYHQIIGSGWITSYDTNYYVREQLITSQERTTKQMYHPLIYFKSLSTWLRHWLANGLEEVPDSFPPFDIQISAGGTDTYPERSHPLFFNSTGKFIKNGCRKTMESCQRIKRTPNFGANVSVITNGTTNCQRRFRVNNLSEELRPRDKFQPIRGAVESNKFDQIRRNRSSLRRKASPSQESRDYFKTSKGRTSFIYLFVNFTHLFLYTIMLKLFVLYSFR